MKKIWITLAIICSTSSLFAQAEHESFKQDKELQMALVNYNLKTFVAEPVAFTCDTVERKAQAADIDLLIKTYFPPVKKTTIRKASETNNGYVQSFGMYTKEDDALYYIRFTLNPLTSKLEEVVVEKN
jgi:hypothetical protein